MMREMRQTWRIASSKSTRFIAALVSLYSSSAPVSSSVSRGKFSIRS